MVVGGDGHKGVPHYYRGTHEKNFFFFFCNSHRWIWCGKQNEMRWIWWYSTVDTWNEVDRRYKSLAKNFFHLVHSKDIATFTLVFGEQRREMAWSRVSEERGMRKAGILNRSLFACKVIIQDYCYYSFVQLTIPSSPFRSGLYSFFHCNCMTWNCVLFLFIRIFLSLCHSCLAWGIWCRWSMCTVSSLRASDDILSYSRRAQTKVQCRTS